MHEPVLTCGQIFGEPVPWPSDADIAERAKLPAAQLLELMDIDDGTNELDDPCDELEIAIDEALKSKDIEKAWQLLGFDNRATPMALQDEPMSSCPSSPAEGASAS
jgi:hypothetical protein